MLSTIRKCELFIIKHTTLLEGENIFKMQRILCRRSAGSTVEYFELCFHGSDVKLRNPNICRHYHACAKSCLCMFTLVFTVWPSRWVSYFFILRCYNGNCHLLNNINNNNKYIKLHTNKESYCCATVNWIEFV